jgi:mono/diheme cytochrome c family protein
MKRRYGALFAAICALAAVGLGAAPLRQASADDGAKKLFNAQCSTCHGIDGRGQTTAGRRAGVKDWTTGTTLQALSDSEITKTIRDGRKDTSGKETMPPVKTLGDDQVKALVAYVRSFQK